MLIFYNRKLELNKH